MKYVSQSKIPIEEAFLMPDRFVILNMWPEGVWYVDREHSEFPKIRQTAIDIAKTFGDKEQLLKLNYQENETRI